MRDARLREAKAILRQWFAGQSIQYLVRVADECRAGTFCFSDGCHCLIGCLFDNPTAGQYVAWKHANAVRMAPGEPRQVPAEMALISLQWNGPEWMNSEELRRRRTLPIVLAEIRKRHRVPTAPPVEVACE